MIYVLGIPALVAYWFIGVAVIGLTDRLMLDANQEGNDWGTVVWVAFLWPLCLVITALALLVSVRAWGIRLYEICSGKKNWPRVN
jgi:hypothetical protein